MGVPAETLVTGASGNIGSHVIEYFSRLGLPVKALVPDEKQAEAVQRSGVETVMGDFEQPDTLRAGMQGMRKLFLLTPSHPKQVDWQRTLVEVAREKAVEQVVKLSQHGAGPDAPMAMGRWHWETERLLATGGPPHTILRPTYLMENFFAYRQENRERGYFTTAFGDAKIAMVRAADVAAVAFKTLVSSGHVNKTYKVTGPEAITIDEAVAKANRRVSPPLVHRAVTPAQWRAHMLEQGSPAWLAEAMMHVAQFVSAGANAEVTDTVAMVGGHEPASFDAFVEEGTGLG